MRALFFIDNYRVARNFRLEVGHTVGRFVGRFVGRVIEVFKGFPVFAYPSGLPRGASKYHVLIGVPLGA